MTAGAEKRAAFAAAVTVLATIASPVSAGGPTVAQPAWSLDESRLTQPIRFRITDLDAGSSACVDLAAHANDKWIAANPIPGDQSSWGAFETLEQRSVDIQKQIAERVSARPTSTGIEKIIADFWRSGMDESRVNALGIKPLESRLAEIDALTDGTSVAAYLRKAAATGDTPLFGFGPEADFKDSRMNIAYAFQGGLGLPDKTYYFDDDKQAIREAYESHVAQVLELSGATATSAATQAKQVMAFETRLAKVSKSSRGTVARHVPLLQPRYSGRGRQPDAELPLDRILRVAGHRGSVDVLAVGAGLPRGSEQDARRHAGR